MNVYLVTSASRPKMVEVWADSACAIERVGQLAAIDRKQGNNEPDWWFQENPVLEGNRTVWIVMTIKEPYQDVFTKVACAANSKWYYSLEQEDYANRVAKYQRSRGYTVTLTKEAR